MSTAGHLYPNPEDFIVTEIPSYPPSGSGEHLFIEVEKTGCTTLDIVGELAKQLGVSKSDVGFAGMKDKFAVARQWFSIPVPMQSEPPLADIGDARFKVLSSKRHPHKLRRGHQKGNRFCITVRDVSSSGFESARAAFEALCSRGIPNLFGNQRFGRDGDNADRALRFLRGQEKAPRDRRTRSLLTSSLQSTVFNLTLKLRMDAGLFTTALLGDIMQKHDTKGLFEVEDAENEQPRLDALQISPTGPMHGKKMRQARGRARAFEEEALRIVGLTEEEAVRLGPGTRRVFRHPMGDSAQLTQPTSDTFVLNVELPSGAYATVVLEHLGVDLSQRTPR